MDEERKKHMRTFAILLVLLGSGVVSHAALAAPLEALRSWWDVDPELLERAIAASQRPTT